jgi:branched-chain amino acid transport system substrate-binding protein
MRPMGASRVRALLAVLGLAALVAGCERDDPSEIKVGAYLSLSGADSTFGTDTREGIELAVEETNARGGVLGKRIRVIYEDDKSNTYEAAQKVRQLIDRNKVVALLGEVASSRTLAAGLIANTSHVPMVTPSSTAVEVTRKRDWVFRACFTDDQQGKVAARFIKDNLGGRTVGIFFAAQDSYSSGLARSFRDEMKRLGGEILVDKGYQKGETSYRTYLSELKAKDPDYVFVPNYYNEMVLIARQAKELGIPGKKFVGGDGWDSSNLVEGAGAELEGAHFTNAYAPDVPWENSKSFVTAFEGKHDREPTSLTAQGYDAALLLFDAIGRSKDATPASIRDALADTKGFKGATGVTTMDREHNANKPVVVVRITNKKFRYETQLMAE